MPIVEVVIAFVLGGITAAVVMKDARERAVDALGRLGAAARGEPPRLVAGGVRVDGGPPPRLVAGGVRVDGGPPRFRLLSRAQFQARSMRVSRSLRRKKFQ